MYDIRRRFPDIARSNEDEINQHLWFYNKEATWEHRADIVEDNEDAHCKNDGSEYAGDNGYKFKLHRTPAPVGEDSPVAKRTPHYSMLESSH
jgi:hypothetical protein